MINTEQIKTLKPVLDKENKFVFFCNNKVAQTSINRKLLKSRSIVWKDNHDAYCTKLSSYTPEFFDLVFKYTIVRSPWSRVLSCFLYLKKLKDKRLSNLNFKQFVLKRLAKQGASFDPHLEEQYMRAYDGDYQFVDFIGRLENIKEDWTHIAGIIGAPKILPRANFTKHKHYSAYYDDATRDIVNRIYARDIEMFGYEFISVN